MKIEVNSPYTIIEGIIRQDPKLWKVARSQWNKLLFHGLLFDYNTKKRFARVIFSEHELFTSNAICFFSTGINA
jgi:hypothetical protein